MRQLAELAGHKLRWKMESMGSVPAQTERSYVLYDGDEPVVEAQVIWQRLSSFDIVMEAGEGTYQAHMDLSVPARTSVAWKAGSNESVAGFQVASESGITATGWINTAAGKHLAWAPIHPGAYEYVTFAPGGPPLVTLAACSFSVSIGGDPGHMLIAAEAAGDPELPALVVLAFALANEQVLLLHRPEPLGARG
jgi:hypothetical protein